MAERYNCCKKTILNYAKEIGYINHYRPELTEEQKKYIVSCYYSKLQKELAEELQVSKSLIGKIWIEAGLQGKSNYQYHYDQDFFRIIDTPEKAYYLGLIASDGCVYKRKQKEKCQSWLRLALQSIDEKVLFMFKDYLHSNKPLSHSIRHGENYDTNITGIEIISDEMVEDLKQRNIVPRKTYIFETPDISLDLYSHYFRGYFDGDGSIYFKSSIFLPSQCEINIAGFQHNLNKMQNILNGFGIKSLYIDDKRQQQNNFNLQFGRLALSSIENKYFFLKYIYQNCGNLYIDRKKEKADQFFNMIDENIGNKRNLYNKIKQECRFQ